MFLSQRRRLHFAVLVAFAASFAVVLAACTPALNWREVRVGGNQDGKEALKALLPCKPDEATRHQSIAGYDVTMTVLGCEAGSGNAQGLFSVAVAEVASRAAVPAVLAQWQMHLLAAMHAEGGTRKVFVVKGADAQPEGTRLLARGMNEQNREVLAQAVWFARGNRLYHAAIYAKQLPQEMTEPFFTALTFE